MRIFTLLVLFLFMNRGWGQSEDSTLLRELDEITVKTYKSQVSPVKALPDIQSTYLFSGKKTELIQLDGAPAHIAEKNARQIFAKVPGVFVYDMDGSGNQINIATRGLDPHRSWEYNVRQNGVMTNSDIYGYPASHYSPPMEAIHRIELVRGTGSLQYGAGFGGMVNYITKMPDTSKVLSAEAIQTAGSFGLLSSYVSLGGKTGRWIYQAYYQRRVSDGYRDHARSDAQGQFASIQYLASDRLSIKAELGRSQYLFQIPGPLTDSMFYENPRQATRTRNYFNPDIYLPSLQMVWQAGKNTLITWVTSAVLGQRNSVQFIGFADKPDLPDPNTGIFSARQVDRDFFNSYTSELRLRQDYSIGKKKAILAVGIQAISNSLNRKQLGVGTTGSDFDLTISPVGYGRDLWYRTRNLALFAENLFFLGDRWTMSPGFRVEYGVTNMSGYISYLDDQDIPRSIEHQFPLFGVQTQYQLASQHWVYGGWSQAYRPVIFADVIPATALDRINPDLQDSRGHNAEIGVRGSFGDWFQYHLTAFEVYYQNRIGSVVLTDNQGMDYVLKTNTGTSRTLGLESYLEVRFVQTPSATLSLFSSTSLMDGVYLEGTAVVGGEEVNLKGNKLETVPGLISRNGLQASWRKWTLVFQQSYVGESYSDALNTEEPAANGSRGIAPAYNLFDINLSFRFSNRILIRAGIQNLTDEQYFTKRPSGYPGPGVFPSDGRGWMISIGGKF